MHVYAYMRCIDVYDCAPAHRHFEASKRVPIFPFATQGGKQTSSSIFDRGTGSKPEMLRSVPLQANLSLIV